MQSRSPGIGIMKSLLFIVGFLAVLPGVDLQAQVPSIIPWPNKVELREGNLKFNSSLRIVCDSSLDQDAVKILAEDFQRVFGVLPQLIEGQESEAGDIVISLHDKTEWTSGTYLVEVGDRVEVVVSGNSGLHAAASTLIQAVFVSEGQLGIRKMRIQDSPVREFRAVMVDVKNQWHSFGDLKTFVDMCRFYKVRYLSLHTGEDQWIGALTEQTGELSAQERKQHRLYSKAEMDELISYASRRGVYLFPHNECTPHFGHMKNAMQKDYNPNDEFAGFADELDGQGSFENYSGSAEPRWMSLMEIAIDKSIEQFAAGYPDGDLPVYHVGPVFGEGGMNSGLAVKILDMIQRKSPSTKMMFWNGASAEDANLFERRDDCIVAYYDDEFGASDFQSYLEKDWNVVNAAWSPLYIVGNKLARPVDKVYRDWNLFRQGSDGVPGGYGGVKWEIIQDPKLGARIEGGLLATWETSQSVHLARLRIRVPAFMEHAWGRQSWPYPAEEWEQFRGRLVSCNQKLSAYINEKPQPPATPIHVEASLGTKKGKVRLNWKSGGGSAASGFRVFRSSSESADGAQQVSPDLPCYVEEYLDATIETGKSYYYFIKAYNEHGVSSASQLIRGSGGTGEARLHSYDSFSVSSTDELVQEKRGEGWSGAWKFRSGAEVTNIEPEGLSYGKLNTKGGCLRFRPKVPENGISLTRRIDGQLGIDDTTMWLSYLVRAEKLGEGDVFVVPASSTPAAIGKNWGRNFAIYLERSGIQMKEGETHLVVARFDFGEGDQISMWIDPSLDQEPQIKNAAVSLRAEVGSKETIDIRLQGHGLGDYCLDEIRMGTSWSAVGGIVNPDDVESPSPNPMTWIGPPSLLDDGSVFMKAATAEDISGVQFYFECTEGGGPDSGWQDSSSWVAKGLSEGVYAYRVKARDMSVNRNETEWSFAGKVTIHP